MKMYSEGIHTSCLVFVVSKMARKNKIFIEKPQPGVVLRNEGY